MVAWETCATGTFGLVERQHHGAGVADLISEMREDMARVVEVAEWPRTVLLAGRSARRYDLSLTPRVMNMLTRVADGLCDWQAPDLPDDLSLDQMRLPGLHRRLTSVMPT